METITISRIRSFNTCQRQHHLRYQLLRRPRRDAEALRFGTLLHGGLEGWWNWWRGGEHRFAETAADQAICALRMKMADAVGYDDLELDPYEVVRLDVLLAAYDARWAGEMDKWEVLGVEEVFGAPLVNPRTARHSITYRIGGKLDVRARLRATGEIWLFEHKSAGADLSPGSTYWQRLRIDGQVSMYHDGAGALGPPIAGCVYDVVAKPGQRPYRATPEADRKFTKGTKCKGCGGTPDPLGTGDPCERCGGSGWAEPPRLYANQRDTDETIDEYRARVVAAVAEAPDEYFARAEIVRLEPELEEHRDDVWLTARHIRDADLAKSYPRNPDACFRYANNPCPYWEVCTGAASIDDDNLFRTCAPHEELLP